MLFNLITPIFHYIMYSLSFIFPITFRSYNAFNGIFDFDANSLNFIQLLTSFWLIVGSIIILYLNHQNELNWQYQYIFKYQLKYGKFNRFLMASIIGCVPLIFSDLFKINLFDKFDYFIYLISFLLITLMFVMLFYFKENVKFNNIKKTRALSIFDYGVLIVLIFVFNLFTSINCSFVVIIYLFLNHYNLRSISFVALILTIITNTIYFVTNIFVIKYFSFIQAIESIVVLFTIFGIYYLIFKTTNNFKKWLSAIIFVITLIIYVLYL